jgi:hypothetical protein
MTDKNYRHSENKGAKMNARSVLGSEFGKYFSVQRFGIGIFQKKKMYSVSPSKFVH